MSKLIKCILILAGLGNIAVGFLHIAMIFVGTSLYRYLGAPAALVDMVQQGQMLKVVAVMLPIAALFIVAGLYALSGANVIRRLPGLRFILLLIGLICTIRGAVVFLWPFPRLVTEIMQRYPNLLGMGRPLLFQDWVFSLIWLIVGVVFLLGWRDQRKSV